MIKMEKEQYSEILKTFTSFAVNEETLWCRFPFDIYKQFSDQQMKKYFKNFQKRMETTFFKTINF